MAQYLGLLAVWECGGGTVLIYLLTTFLKVDQHVAQGANLLFFIPTCITAIMINIKNKNISYKVAVPIIISGVIGAIAGAKLSVNMPIKELRKYFGIFLMGVSVHEIYSLKKEYRKSKKTNNKSIKK